MSSAGVRPGLRKLTVRVAERADEPALAALEQASPDGSPVSVRLQPRLGYLDVADRYPGTTGFVALAPGRLGIVGMLFSSVAPTQFNGSVVPGAYLFSLRVHPAVRRRGVAASLIRHALDQARREAGIEVAWAAVMSGNEPSLRTFSRAGFAPTRGLMLRIRFPGRPRPRTDPAHTLRRAIDPDLSAMADVLNHANARHNLWRPATPSNLAAQFGAAGHGLADVPLVVDRDGRIIAVGAVFDVRRAFSPQAVDLRGVPALLSRAVSSMVTRVALRPLVLRDRALLDSEPAAASRLLRSIQGLQTARLSTLIVPVDICDPAWPTVVRATQLTRRLHVMLWSTMRSDENRPLALT